MEKFNQIKIGMSEQEVISICGNPHLTSKIGAAIAGGDISWFYNKGKQQIYDIGSQYEMDFLFVMKNGKVHWKRSRYENANQKLYAIKD